MTLSNKNEVFENYPLRIVLLANLLSLGIYALGSVILWQLSWWAVLPYLALCVFQEIKLMASGCVHCYYYNKRCFSGRGKVSALFFKQGEPEKFSCRTLTWLSLLPDMLIGFIPLGIGVFLLIRNFEWTVLLLVAGLAILAFPGNGYIRGTKACCHCRQKELGCPADRFFQKS